MAIEATGRERTWSWGQNAARRGSALVTIWLALVVVAVNTLAPRLPGGINMYAAQPLLWVSLAGLAGWLWRQEHAGQTLPRVGHQEAAALSLGAGQIVLTLLAGILAGFGRSPYNHGLPWLLLNLLFVACQLLGQETCRWYLLDKLAGRRPALGLVAAWLAGVAAVVPLSSFALLVGSGQGGLQVLGKTVLPAVAEGALATYLALIGGPSSSLAYRGILALFLWLAPVLPDLRWSFAAFIGVALPVIGFLVMHRIAAKSGGTEARQNDGVGWVIAALVVVFLFWLNTGLFGIRLALTNGISMEPTMHMGDLVITREITADQVRLGDIVRFRSGDSRMSVLHRVVDIREANGQQLFTTWGDNNPSPDEPWTADRLEGRLAGIVPKVGWVSIYSRQLLNLIFKGL